MGRPKGSLNKKHINKIKYICPTCKKEFEKYPSYQKKFSVKGHLIYCSRLCADKNRKNVWKYFGKDMHSYKDGKSSYRQNALRIKGYVCTVCGYNGQEFPSLIWVHHKDFSKRGNYNNNLDNLEILCVRCHLEKHLSLENSYALSIDKTKSVDVCK